MALTIGQIAAVSYPAVLAEKRKAANQWEESAFLNAFEEQGGIERKSLGTQIEAPLDYRANPNGGFQVTDLAPFSLNKTEVVTSAVYDIAEIVYPVVWSNKDEVQNPSENQKIALVAQLLSNGISSHDDLIEQAFFYTTTTNSFVPLLVHMATAGTGSDGGIDSGTETWWGNKQATYVDDTDIEAAMTSAYNAASKGTGAKLKPTLAVSDGATNAIFEGTQQALQRWDKSQTLKAGFTSIMFKTMNYVFSQYGTSNIFMVNPMNLKLVVSKEYFRDRRETTPIPNATGYSTVIYSALNLVTNNRSRLAVVHT
jgi:hypothetical protein